MIMKRWLSDLDRILRGEATRLGSMRGDSFDIPLGGTLLVILLLAMVYGVCMGFFAGVGEGGPFFMQWFASIAKVPSLFFLTVAVTFPSLYVFNALVGSRLTFVAIFQLLVASLAVTVAVLASLGPIVAFFSVSTTSYPFIVLLNVLAFVVSGVLGSAFMLQTLYRLEVARRRQVPSVSETMESRPEGESSSPIVAQAVEETGALWGVRGYALDRNVKRVFVSWMIVFGLVCAQMAWVLKPFLGKPGEAFQWFGPRESSFIQAFWEAMRTLLS
jgi:hypothetical protein